jgi:hypothetical protein
MPGESFQQLEHDRIPVEFDHISIGISIIRRNPIGFRVAIRHPDP